MASDREFEIFLVELFAPVGGVTLRKMFGGIGIFRSGLMFGLVVDGQVCLKSDEQTNHAFIDEGLEEWSYSSKGKTKTMGYWYVPERLLDDPEEMKPWALEIGRASCRERV